MPSRGKDLADVYALIKANKLPRVYALELDRSVRQAYVTLWDTYDAARLSGAEP